MTMKTKAFTLITVALSCLLACSCTKTSPAGAGDEPETPAVPDTKSDSGRSEEDPSVSVNDYEEGTTVTVKF